MGYLITGVTVASINLAHSPFNYQLALKFLMNARLLKTWTVVVFAIVMGILNLALELQLSPNLAESHQLLVIKEDIV